MGWGMRDSILQWLRSFIPQKTAVDRFERMRASVGALFGILLTGLLSYVILPHNAATVWLIAPMGASAVLLFAVPSSPLAQPWSIIGGNLAAVLVGLGGAGDVLLVDPQHHVAHLHQALQGGEIGRASCRERV